MKLTLKGKTLLQLLKSVAPAAAGNSPGLNCALLRVQEGTLQATCTNLEEFLIDSVQVEEYESGASVYEVGEMTFPLDLLGVLARLTHRDVTLESDGKSLHLSAGKTSLTVPTVPVADIPSPPQMHGQPLFRIESFRLKRLLRLTSYTMLKSQNPSVLAGLQFSLGENQLRLISTEGSNRISVASDDSCGDWEETQFVLPATAVHLLEKTLTDDGHTACFTDGKMVRFSVGSVEIITRTLDGTFPDCLKFVRRVEELKKVQVVFNRVACLDALKRVLFVAEVDADLAGKAVFSLEGDALHIQASSVLGQEVEDEVSLDGETDAPHLTFACSVPYLIECLDRMSGDAVEMGLVDGKTPILLRTAGDGGYVHLVGLMVI